MTETRQMKHTPGPWCVIDGDVKHTYNVCGSVNVVRNVRKEANAILIAASPGLLSLVEEMLSPVGWEDEIGGLRSWKDRAEALIAGIKKG